MAVPWRRPISERTARTDADIRLYAEKAAFEALYLKPFFNGLQAVTIQKLSPETRLFAKVSYESKLAHLVATALIECAKSDVGREMAMQRLRSNEFQNIHATWAPLIDHCTLLLRELRMDATCDRLSRLSDLWEAVKQIYKRQARRLREVVKLAFNQLDGNAVRATEELLDWTELYSIEPLQSQVIDRFAIDDQQCDSKRIIVVKWNETFSAAEEFLDKEIARNCQVHVIFGNEDDAARFKVRIFDRYCSHRILLNWRGKKFQFFGEYRGCDSSENPNIIIGSLNYFARMSRVERNTTSVVILHAERTLASTFVNSFEEGSLDRFLSELFVLTTITVHHFHEIEKCLKENQDNLTELIQSWPREYQVFDQDTLINQWKHYCMSYGNEARNTFIEYIRNYSEIWIAQRMIKEYEGIEYVRHNCSLFVRSAVVARIAKLGDTYVMYSERSSDKLTLRIRLKRQLNDNFGLLQFLELRHGCEMTPYKIKCGTTQHSYVENYERVLIIERNNPFRCDEGSSNSLKISKPISVPVHEKFDNFEFESFPNKICEYAQGWQNYNYLIIVVCCNMRLLNNSIHHLRANNVNASFCETPLGLLNESSKNRSVTAVVCTTSACFEGWTFLPRTREYLKIIIGHHKNDTSSLEVAYDLAKAQEILSISWENPNNLSKIKKFQAGREKENENTTTFGSSASLTEKRMESHSTTDNVNHLLKAKRLLHKKLQLVARTAKAVHALLPPPKLDSSDTPMDIACGGFLKQARLKMEEVTIEIRNVEKLLTSQEFTLDSADLCGEELQTISNRYLIDKNELSSFLATIRNVQPVSWSRIRSEVMRFNLLQDADRHYDHCFGDPDSSKEIVAINTANVSPSINSHRQFVLPKDYRKWMLQRSDRHLEDCTLYVVDSEEAVNELLAVEDASLERFLDCRELSVKSKNFEKKNTSAESVMALLNSVVVDSTAKNNKCPTFLFPRRCYDRLTRDLFDSGLLIADDYCEIEKQMNQCDTIQLPLINAINKNPPKSQPVEERIPLETILRAESALLEYGSLQWMEWFARRLKYYKYAPEAIAFYHQTIAERHFCVQDEQLITRFENALAEMTPGRQMTSTERMIIDGFVYNTMDSLEWKERQVVINPPFESNEALNQLSHFIRSKRRPPA